MTTSCDADCALKMHNCVKTIFIIPYRSRENQKKYFISMMSDYLATSSSSSYKFVFAQQCDTRPFNRGAMKNIGFLAMKKLYPDTYKDITFVFHDVDTIPNKESKINYTTTSGKVAHYYGYTFALGGMFAIKGGDFEKSGGFPNFWGWGLEDNVMQERCLSVGLEIDRSVFYDISDKTNIARSFDGFNRVISKRDAVVYKKESPDSMNNIQNSEWIVVDDDSTNTTYVNISKFDVDMNPNEQVYTNYDIRNGSKLAVPRGFNRRVWNMNKLFI